MIDLLMSYIPHGEQNAITTQDLVRIGNFKSPRDLQEQIENLRCAGHVIASKCHDGGGYFIPESSHELKTFIKTVENRAKHTLRSLQSAKKMLDDMENAE